MKKVVIILISFYSVVMGITSDLEKQKAYADSLFLAGEYFDAITEYKRYHYFSQSGIDKYFIYNRIAMCYKGGAKYNDAVKYFRFALKNSQNKNDSLQAELQIVRVNILRRTIPEALKILENVEQRYFNNIDSSTLNYWRGWAYLMDDNWEAAENEFSKWEGNPELKNLAGKVSNERYSVGFAKTISFILPGAGQFYTGNYLSGIMSLGWNALLGYLTINAFYTDRAVEGILIGGLLWARFYRGNFQNAEKFAIQKNREISKKAYEYLAKEYKGVHP